MQLKFCNATYLLFLLVHIGLLHISVHVCVCTSIIVPYGLLSYNTLTANLAHS